MTDTTDTQTRVFKFAYFLIGIALPIAAYVAWSKTGGFGRHRKARAEKAQEIAVEDSFPASDPPSSW